MHERAETTPVVTFCRTESPARRESKKVHQKYNTTRRDRKRAATARTWSETSPHTMRNECRAHPSLRRNIYPHRVFISGGDEFVLWADSRVRTHPCERERDISFSHILPYFKKRLAQTKRSNSRTGEYERSKWEVGVESRIEVGSNERSTVEFSGTSGRKRRLRLVRKLSLRKFQARWVT